MSANRPRIPWLALLPLIAFVALAGLFKFQLDKAEKTTDAKALPSALVGKQVPVFALPAIDGTAGEGFSDADLKLGQVTLVNVFASWCGPCREEHPLLMQLARDPKLKALGVQLYGLNYKDEATQARGFLAQYGNPYARTGADVRGRAGIDWGVFLDLDKHQIEQPAHDTG